MKKALIFLSAMYVALVVGSAFTIWALGMSDRVLGTPLANLALSALFSIPIAILGALGFFLARHKALSASRVFVALSGVASGATFFAWGAIAQFIPNTAVNLVAIGVYSIVLGLLSATVLSRVEIEETHNL